MAHSTKASAIEPLRDLLGEVIGRIEALESKVGISAPLASLVNQKASSTRALAPASGHSIGSGGEVPAVKAYDAYMKSAVIPFCAACDDIGMATTGKLVVKAWEGIRTVIVLASRSKPPSDTVSVALQPYLSVTHDAVKELQSQKLARELDCHYKAVTEMLAAVSWVLLQAPQQLPAGYVKESLGSAEFWTNRIRKDQKGDDKHTAFCDTIKKVIVELTEYIQTHHTTGLSFNVKSGVSLAEAAIRLSDEPVAGVVADPVAEFVKSPGSKRHPTLGNVVVGGNVAGIIGELSKRKNADGTSAATGLKKVNKDQQTWRKEFKKDEAKIVLPPAPSLDASQAGTKKKDKKKLTGLPIFEYQDRGFKWVIENHSKESVIKEASQDGVITVEISDPKQQVYLYNCDGITVKVNGKFKSLVLDKCEGCAVVYDTLISSAEMVNCKKIQLQVNGVCPVFTIDKTVNVLIWLSKESVEISNFTTSLSSEMNVSFPDGEDQKEVPIPEQYVHKLVGGKLTSEVSDLYN